MPSWSIGGLPTGSKEYARLACEAALAARQAFQDCQSRAPNDPVPGVFLKRIDYLEAEPPGADWDGVWTFQTK